MMPRFLALDLRLSEALRVAERPGFLRTVMAILAHSGDSWFWLAGLGLTWWLGPLAWRPPVQKVGLAVLLLAGLVLLIKFSVRRSRPAGEWGSIYRTTDPHSFPSGHAARAILLAVLLAGLGPQWLAAVVLVWAPLVALARVAMGLHYLSDVLAGSVLGAALAYAVLRLA